MRQRNAAVTAATCRGGYAGYDFEWDAVLAQHQGFFAAATEDVRIAALEAQPGGGPRVPG